MKELLLCVYLWYIYAALKKLWLKSVLQNSTGIPVLDSCKRYYHTGAITAAVKTDQCHRDVSESGRKWVARVVFNVLDWIIGSIGLGNNDIARIICSHLLMVCLDIRGCCVVVMVWPLRSLYHSLLNKINFLSISSKLQSTNEIMTIIWSIPPYKGQVTLGPIGPTYIAVYTNILSGGEITSPAENVRLTGMYLQRTSPNKTQSNRTYK